jgi:transcription termination/antitermination protein NusA
MKSYAELVKALEAQKGVPVVKILEAIGESIKAGYKKTYDDDENILIKVDAERCGVGVYQMKEVLDEDETLRDKMHYIDLASAREIDPVAKPGDSVAIEVDASNFGIRASQVAKSKFNEYLHKSELTILEEDFKAKIGEIIGGDFQRRNKGNIYINLGKVEGVLPIPEQSPRDRYKIGDRIKSYIKDVRVDRKVVKVLLSRTDVNFIKKLFEQEIPEIYDKSIEIKGIAREPGKKTKVIVYSKKTNIDPVGACVGMKGVRIQAIVQELNGEMIDVVRWSDNPKVLIQSLLKPAEIGYVAILEKEKKAIVVVRADQLSLAIGNKGLNAKLAARASGWSIDIKTEDQFEDIRKQEEGRLKAQEALGLGPKEEEEVVEEVEYQIDEGFSLKDLGLADSIIRKLESTGYSKIEKLIDTDESELIDKAGLTIKQAQKVVSTIKEAIVIEEEEPQETGKPETGSAETDSEKEKK